MSATIFILGGGGFIGFNLAKKLSENNYNVVIIDNFIPKVPITFNCTYYCGDIRNITDMLVLVEKYNPDCFIWAVDLLPCNNLYYDVCINGLTTILNIMNISNIKQFIYLSSSEIYGNCEYANENTMCAPLTTEGKTKLLSEDIIKKNIFMIILFYELVMYMIILFNTFQIIKIILLIKLIYFKKI
jgi:nucleoside-diphosphate-sugar epimerase